MSTDVPTELREALRHLKNRTTKKPKVGKLKTGKRRAGKRKSRKKKRVEFYNPATFGRALVRFARAFVASPGGADLLAKLSNPAEQWAGPETPLARAYQKAKPHLEALRAAGIGDASELDLRPLVHRCEWPAFRDLLAGCEPVWPGEDGDDAAMLDRVLNLHPEWDKEFAESVRASFRSPRLEHATQLQSLASLLGMLLRKNPDKPKEPKKREPMPVLPKGLTDENPTSESPESDNVLAGYRDLLETLDAPKQIEEKIINPARRNDKLSDSSREVLVAEARAKIESVEWYEQEMKQYKVDLPRYEQEVAAREAMWAMLPEGAKEDLETLKDELDTCLTENLEDEAASTRATNGYYLADVAENGREAGVLALLQGWKEGPAIARGLQKEADRLVKELKEEAASQPAEHEQATESAEPVQEAEDGEARLIEEWVPASTLLRTRPYRFKTLKELLAFLEDEGASIKIQPHGDDDALVNGNDWITYWHSREVEREKGKRGRKPDPENEIVRMTLNRTPEKSDKDIAAKLRRCYARSTHDKLKTITGAQVGDIRKAMDKCESEQNH